MNNSEEKILNYLIRRSELVGSRGRSKYYNKPAPVDSDYDYAMFQDDPKEFDKLKRKLLKLFEEYNYKLHQRSDGYTVSGNNMDISLYPTNKKENILEAWKLQEQGMSKEEAWKKVNNQRK